MASSNLFIILTKPKAFKIREILNLFSLRQIAFWFDVTDCNIHIIVEEPGFKNVKKKHLGMSPF